jgi:GAF domain-containing protein
LPICDFLRYWEIPLFCFHVKHLDTPDRQQLAAISALRIRQSSGLEQILQTAVQEVQQLLECDRVTIYQVVPNSDRNFTEDKFAKLQLNKLCEAGAGNFSHPITEFITFVAKNYQPCLQDLKLITKNKSQASIFTPQNRQKVPQTYSWLLFCSTNQEIPLPDFGVC